MNTDVGFIFKYAAPTESWPYFKSELEYVVSTANAKRLTFPFMVSDLGETYKYALIPCMPLLHTKGMHRVNHTFPPQHSEDWTYLSKRDRSSITIFTLDEEQPFLISS